MQIAIITRIYSELVMFLIYPLLLLSLISMQVEADNDAYSFYSDVSIVGYSEPVSIYDMANGWTNDFSPGDHAFADGVIKTGIFHQNSGLFISYGQRRYYYLEMDDETSQWYRSLEIDAVRQSEDDIAFDIELLESNGWFGGWKGQISIGQYALDAEIEAYWLDVNEYQLGTVNGTSFAGEGTDVSAIVDYFYSEDKLFDFNPPVDSGRGMGLSLRMGGDFTDDMSWAIDIDDAYNRYYFNKAAFTEGCIQIGDVPAPICNSQSSLEGRSGVRSKTHTIDIGTSIQLSSSRYRTSITAEKRGRFEEVSLDYRHPLISGVDIVGQVTSLSAIGIGLEHSFAFIFMALDKSSIKEARAAKIRLGVNIPFSIFN